jgi:putative transposase
MGSVTNSHTHHEALRVSRLGRYFLPDQPQHVIQRGNNRGAIFFDGVDYQKYRDWLGEAAAEFGCRIHAYVLMTNHVHLLVTPLAADSLPRTMQSLGRRYVRYVTDRQGARPPGRAAAPRTSSQTEASTAPAKSTGVTP